MYSGAADHSLELLKICAPEITDACQKIGKTLAGEKQITSIKNTMSDGAATNIKFNSLLERYREEVLPMIASNWGHLAKEERAAVAKINDHFCGLHLVLNLAEQCNSVLTEWEIVALDGDKHGAATLPGSSAHSTESGTLRLIRTACKA